ncbi:MAG: hypothetical protein JRN23_03200 [Nitrososphaerota archaeon]|nr:hypothetical protein [Nitrososphaerota archaeon]MDG6977996.1 hypothetical protein [Nitrososphaerota archaeon]MDG7020920.1 hypothetical protein [Nitrososphaerota archaeon]
MRLRTLLVLGTAVREAFSFWTGHPFDFEVWVRVGYWVSRGWSPYAALPFAPGVSFANDFNPPGIPLNHAAIGYLPFWPLLLAGIYKLYTLVGFGDRFVYYFMIKQPIILADVLLGYLLYLYVEQRRPDWSRRVLVLWLFSPYPIIISAIWGTFDSMAMVCVMAALLVPPGRSRSVWEGLATLVKSIPVVLILPLTYAREKRVRNFIIAFGLPSAITLAVPLLAGWPMGVNCILSQCERENVLNTLYSTLGKSGFPLSLWGTWVYLNVLHVVPDSTFNSVFDWGGYLWIPSVVVASLLSRRWFGFSTEKGVIRSLLVIYLTFLLVRGQVNEQYAIYLVALLLLDAALYSPGRIRLFYVVTAVVLADLVTNNILLLRFLSPVDPGILTVEAHLIAAVNPLRNALLYAEGLAFSVLNLWYLAALIKERSPGGYAA